MLSTGADPGIGSVAKVRVWQGVEQMRRRSRPGEGAGGGTPPALGERCSVSSPSGAWGGAPEVNGFCVLNPPKVRKNGTKNVITLLRR